MRKQFTANGSEVVKVRITPSNEGNGVTKQIYCSSENVKGHELTIQPGKSFHNALDTTVELYDHRKGYLISIDPGGCFTNNSSVKKSLTMIDRMGLYG